MGTRSQIGIQNADGTVTGIYCHWDGYPSYNGRVLQDHYTDEAKIRELMAIGDISSLGEEIGEKHDFDKAPKGQCNSYSRDRGEEDCEAKNFANAREFFDNFPYGGIEWAYLFKDGEWMVRASYNGMGWMSLKAVLESKEEV